jgi:hypothetical protein
MTDGRSTAWLDKLAIAELLTRYFQLVDDKDFTAEKMQAIFTDNGAVTRPNGAVTTGPAEIAESNRKSFARFRVTQHLPAGYLVDINGDEATVRLNVMAMHLWADGFGDPNALDRHFVGGIVIQASARRTADGWRLTDLSGRNIWRGGSAFGMMAQTKKG